MSFKATVLDVWVFRRRAETVEFLLLHASQEKADRWFNGGRFWQIPSGLRSVHEYVTGPGGGAPELQLR